MVFPQKNASSRGQSAVRLLGTPSVGLQGELRDTWADSPISDSWAQNVGKKKHGKTMMIVDECEW
jgi:hypothetical protein